MRKNIKINCVIRADGNFKIGHGHLKRCLALSELLKDYCIIHFCSNNIPKYIKQDLKKIGVNIILLPTMSPSNECKYIFNKIKNFDLIIIDGYNFHYNYQNFFYKKNKKIIIIDDLIYRKFSSHIIINHAPLVSKLKYKNLNKSKLGLGLKYKIVQKCFYSNKILDRSKLQNNIFICLGSGDSNMTVKIKLINFLLKLEDIKKIFLVSSQKRSLINRFKGVSGFNRLIIYENIASKDIFKLMQKSRFGICSSSTVAIESFTASLPLLVGYSANNQLNIYKGLTKSKVALGIGSFQSLKIDKLKSMIKILEDNNYLNKHFYSHKEAHNLSSRKKLLDKILL